MRKPDRRLSVLGRYAVRLFLPCILLLLILAFWYSRFLIRTETEIVMNNETQNLRLQRKIITGTFKENVEDLLYLTGQTMVGRLIDSGLPDDGVPPVKAVLRSFMRRKPVYQEITILSEDGRTVLRMDYPRGGSDPEDSDKASSILAYLPELKTLKPRELYVSPFVPDAAGIPRIIFCMPLETSSGRRVGYFALNFDASSVLDDMKAVSVHSFGELWFVSGTGAWRLEREAGWEYLPADELDRLFSKSFTSVLLGKMAMNDSQYISDSCLVSIESAEIPLAEMAGQVSLKNANCAVLPDGRRACWHVMTTVHQDLISSRADNAFKDVILFMVLSVLAFAGFTIVLTIARIRREADEEELRDEANIFNDNPAPILRFGPDGTLSRANMTAQGLFRLGSGGDSISSIFPEFPGKSFAGLGPEGFEQFEKQVGATVFLFTVRMDSSENLILYGTDITLRKEAEEKLKKLSVAVEQSANAIIITDTSGNIVFANRAFERTTGYSIEEVTGKNPHILKSGKQGPEVYAKLWETIKKGGVWHGQFLNKRKDGSLFWEEAVITPIKNDRGEIVNFLAVKEDITRRKEAEDALKRAKEEAESANRLKSEFLANMSHEIRTPMNAIIGFTDLILGSSSDKDIVSKLKVIRDSGKTLLNIISDILDFSKIEAGKITIEKKNFFLRDMIFHIVELFTPKAREKHLEFTVTVSDGIPSFVNGDEFRLAQILTNILSNAIKFTKKGYVRFFCDYQEGTAIFKVEDSGIGIAPDKIGRIFSAFEQADSSTERQFGGTGLGLAISRKLAELMGGEVYVQSVLGVGSSFALMIPLSAVKGGGGSDSIEAESLAENVPQPDRTFRILVAEDNPANQELIQAFLESIGLSCDCVENGKLALEALSLRRYDLLLLDIQMPVMDGEETIKRIRGDESLSGLHVIALTANAMKGDEERYRSLGCDDYLSKPIDREAFNRIILRLAGRSPSESQEVSALEQAPLPQGERDSLSQILDVLAENLRIFNPKVVRQNADILLASSDHRLVVIGKELASSAEGFDDEILKGAIEQLKGVLVHG
jgi:PAS domain S-box-containing protein